MTSNMTTSANGLTPDPECEQRPSRLSAHQRSTDRPHRSGITHLFELPRIDVIDEAAHADRVGTARRQPRMGEDRRQATSHIPGEALHVVRVARRVEWLDRAAERMKRGRRGRAGLATREAAMR